MNTDALIADRAAAQDALLVRAVEAVNRGDLEDAHTLAEQVLASDQESLDARTLLATEGQPTAEVRRITVMFCDLVGSTSLSGRLDPELYHSVLVRYRKLATSIVTDRHGGFVSGFKGDGMLALFGYPTVRGNDTERGVLAALEIATEVEAFSNQIAQTIGEQLAVRAALHRGLLYLDPEQEDVYGLAANVAARLQELAQPGQVVVSDEVRQLVADKFETKAGAAQPIRGVELPIQPFTILARKTSQPTAADRSPLVGRSAEMDRLRGVWEAAQASDSSSVSLTVVGEPGIGKSRLVSAFADELAADGASVVTLAGSSDHRGVGFHPLRRLIESRCGIGAASTTHDQLNRLGQELESLGFTRDDTLPLIAPILGLDPEAGYVEADAEGRKLTEEIAKEAVEYVLACMGDGPAMLLVEDQHAVDQATNDLVERILESGRLQTLVVATSRTPPGEGVPYLELGPLSRDACLALIDAVAPAGLRTTVDRGELVERSDGVPLFLEELVRGSAHEAIAGLSLPARSSASTVPDVLYEPLMARLYTNASTVAVASTAATIGRDVDLELLRQSVPLPAKDVDDAVAALVDANILERVPQERQTVRFRHELVRDVANDLISPSRRREVHARVGDALLASVENDERTDWTIIASHFEGADRPLDAAKAWREAADDARRRGLVAEARLRLDMAINQVQMLASGPERNELEVDLRLLRGYLASSSEGMGKDVVRQDFERCLELITDAPHAPNMVSTLVTMWGYYTARGDLARTRQVSTAIQSLVFGADWGAFWRPSNVAGFGMIDWWEGNFESADRQLRQGIQDLYSRENVDAESVAAWYLPNHPTTSMHVHLALARFMVGDTRGADEHGQRAMALCDDLQFPQGPWSAAYARWLLAWMYMERGDYERSFALLSELSALGEQHGYDSWSLVATTQHTATKAARLLALSAGASTRHDRSLLGSMMAVWEGAELRIGLPAYVTMLGRLDAAAGDTEAACGHFDHSLELASTTQMHFYDAETLRCRAHLAHQADEVVRKLEEALAVARQQGARPFELRIAIDLHDIRGEAAIDELRRAVENFPQDASYAELDDARARLAGTRR
ncbi:MAG TPA: adenylate/guanylate cyclase domain-containing protein [Aeromicrobium sp.]|nr:adenylate/guanylate cyclase domain-containing protein [Aeromicrobium sp.]